MSRKPIPPKPDPVEFVARSQRGMIDAVRQVLARAANEMGGLERCDATISPQMSGTGSDSQFQIRMSVTKRPSQTRGA